MLAYVLIAVGAVLLLLNVGVLNAGMVTSLLSFWPLLLILLGLSLIFGAKERRAAAVAGGLLTFGILWFAYNTVPLTSVQAQGETQGQAVGLAQGLEGAQRAEINISSGVAALFVGASEGRNLIEGTIEAGNNERLETHYEVSRGTGRYTLESRRREGFSWRLPWQGRRVWHLLLSPNVPLELTISTGVGESDLDLRRLDLSRLSLSTGVGETRLYLPERGSLSASIETGVGETTVTVPEGMAARIEISQGVGSVNVSPDFERQGNVYTSRDYDSAHNRVELRIGGGVGAINVRR